MKAIILLVVVSALFIPIDARKKDKCDGPLKSTTLLNLYFNNDMGVASQKIVEAFKEMDKDKDGIIKRDEVKKFNMKGAALSTPGQEKVSLGSIYKFADATGNYEVTTEEFTSASQKLLTAEFKYCGAYCQKLQDKLQQCNVKNDERLKSYSQQADFAVSLCKLGGQQTIALNKCLIDTDCAKLDYCFRKYMFYDTVNDAIGVINKNTYPYSAYDNSFPVASVDDKQNITADVDLIKRKIYRRNVGMVFADVLVPLTAGITIIMLSVFFGSPLVLVLGSLLGLGTIIGGTIALVMLTDYILYNNVVQVVGPAAPQ
ncbi:hypothetical protein MP228_000831 [Amoeboaphelidium protococcarum]|nr:hypothetical protein MP228_000831 [Amoeboaphelidium protococcarum]